MSEPQPPTLPERLARAPFLPALRHVDARFTVIMEMIHRLELQVRHEGLRELGERIRADAQAAVQSGAFAERAMEEVTDALIDATALLRRVAGALPARDPDLEIPFLFRALADVPRGGLVLDVDGAAGTAASSLALLGYRTTVLDPRGYPWRHPLLTVVAEEPARWSGPGDGTFDAIACLRGPAGRVLDGATVGRFHAWLRPGGRLVLSLPYGDDGGAEAGGPGARAAIAALLADWQVTERAVFERGENTPWSPHAPGDAPWQAGSQGLALISAVK